jgi:hypothetical protein
MPRDATRERRPSRRFLIRIDGEIDLAAGGGCRLPSGDQILNLDRVILFLVVFGAHRFHRCGRSFGSTLIWAHTGVGPVVRPIQDHVANLEKLLQDSELLHLYFDVSWDEVPTYRPARRQRKSRPLCWNVIPTISFWHR